MMGSADKDMESAGESRRLSNGIRLASGAVFVGALVAFAYAASVVDHFPGELAASSWVQSWRTPWLDSAMKLVSVAGVVAVAAALVLVAALSLFLNGLRYQAGFIVAATVVGYGLRTGLKVAVGRPRPTADVVEVIAEADGYAFPSGHVMHYVVFLGVLVFVLSTGVRPGVRRRLIQGAVVALLVLMGLSRIYVGVHWLGDVVAGYAFGAVVLAGSVWLWKRWERSEGKSLDPDRAS
jgi:undecaprenyl-diphosphatase